MLDRNLMRYAFFLSKTDVPDIEVAADNYNRGLRASWKNDKRVVVDPMGNVLKMRDDEEQINAWQNLFDYQNMNPPNYDVEMAKLLSTLRPAPKPVNYRLLIFNWFFFINACVGTMCCLNSLLIFPEIDWYTYPSLCINTFSIPYWLNRLI